MSGNRKKRTRKLRWRDVIQKEREKETEKREKERKKSFFLYISIDHQVQTYLVILCTFAFPLMCNMGKLVPYSQYLIDGSLEGNISSYGPRMFLVQDDITSIARARDK